MAKARKDQHPRSEPPPRSSLPPPPSRPKGDSPGWGFAAVIGLVIASIVVVVTVTRAEPPDRERDPLELTDPAELRAVVEGVSRCIQTQEGPDHERAVAALEALHPRSPGPLDLRDACATTYRGMLELPRLVELQRRALLPPDASAPPAVSAEVLEANRQANRIIEEVRESHHRCSALYEAGCGRLGIQPASRFHRR
ncbi:MAG: hypothetical protein HY909_17240 [Deltaproteobacteria bacterium]|nr:hypothetical protein [Deltaproteobacteria bacterium]